MGYHLNKLKMALGGAVKGYAAGGNVDIVDNPFADDFIGGVAVGRPETRSPFVNSPVNASNFVRAPQMPTFAAPAEPVMPPAPALTQPASGVAGLLEKYYGSAESPYAKELTEARTRSKEETETFNKMLTGLMEKGSEQPSKAELYFNLMSAFGEPTKTGSFGETLGKVGKVTSEYAKEMRTAKNAETQMRKQLALEAQKIKMQGAKEELGTLRTLAGEEMKDKRAIATEMIKEYVKSGQPESAAGKQAKDEGFKPGTAEYQKRVKEIADMNVEKQLSTINSTLAGLSIQQANLALNQQKFGLQEKQAAKLTPGELKLKTEAEDNLSNMDQALADLSQAYKLNPNTFDSSLVDTAQQKLLEAAGSKDPKVIATRTQSNLLGKQGIAKLRASFGGNPTEGERKILLDLEGIGAKSKEERAIIMRNAYSALKAKRDRENKRLNEINQGLYRETTPAPGGLE